MRTADAVKARGAHIGEAASRMRAIGGQTDDEHIGGVSNRLILQKVCHTMQTDANRRKIMAQRRRRRR